MLGGDGGHTRRRRDLGAIGASVGSMITLYLETGSGLELKAQSLQDELEALDTSAGARLFASWNTQFAHILPGE